MAKLEWAYPGARVLCVDDRPDNGLALNIRRGARYTITKVWENGFVSGKMNPMSVALAEVSERDKRNEFWLERFEPIGSH